MPLELHIQYPCLSADKARLTDKARLSETSPEDKPVSMSSQTPASRRQAPSRVETSTFPQKQGRCRAAAPVRTRLQPQSNKQGPRRRLARPNNLGRLENTSPAEPRSSTLPPRLDFDHGDARRQARAAAGGAGYEGANWPVLVSVDIPEDWVGLGAE